MHGVLGFDFDEDAARFLDTIFEYPDLGLCHLPDSDRVGAERLSMEADIDAFRLEPCREEPGEKGLADSGQRNEPGTMRVIHGRIVADSRG